MNNSIEDQIFQNELLKSNKLFLDEENETKFNLNPGLFHKIISINNSQYINKDSFHETNFNEKLLLETNKSIILNEVPNNYSKTFEITSNFRLNKENEYSENLFNFKINDKFIFDDINLSNDEFKDIYQIPKKATNSSENGDIKTFLFKKTHKDDSSSKSSHLAIFNPKDKKSTIRKFFRVEDAKKHFKVAINNYATEQLNALIKQSELPNKYKKKIHLPNYKLLTANSKELDNLDFLSYEMKTIFIYGKNDGNLQEENERNILKILRYDKNPEKAKKIKEFLSLKYEDIIQLFYKSENFNEFKNRKLTIFFN